MKNIIKKINLLRLTALFVAGGIALAFNTPIEQNALLTEYGRMENGSWVKVESAAPGTGPGQYTCEISDKVCRALFESQPAPNEEPLPENVIQADGDFLLH